jgi:hypothetical protein
MGLIKAACKDCSRLSHNSPCLDIDNSHVRFSLVSTRIIWHFNTVFSSPPFFFGADRSLCAAASVTRKLKEMQQKICNLKAQTIFFLKYKLRRYMDASLFSWTLYVGIA